MVEKLSKRVVDGLEPKADAYIVRDAEVKGFSVRVFPSGKKLFLFAYRNQHGRQRKVSIGAYGAVTPDQARARAKQLAGWVATGKDPSGEKKEDREAMTLSAFCAVYLERHARLHKKPKSIAEDERNLAKWVKPRLGRLKVAAITRADVARLHTTMASRPVCANRVLALLSKMFALAEVWGYRPEGANPVRHIEKFKEKPKERFLSPDEMKALRATLDEVERTDTEPASAITAIRLLMETGLRLGEVLNLRREHLDLEHGRIHLDDSKTGPRTIPISRQAIEILKALPDDAPAGFVCPGRKHGARFVGIHHVWDRIRRKAGLPGVRIHDLRHSFASAALAAGMPLERIGGLLGHKTRQTTMRYAHLSDALLKSAADAVGDYMEKSVADAKRKVIEVHPKEEAQ